MYIINEWLPIFHHPGSILHNSTCPAELVVVYPLRLAQIASRIRFHHPAPLCDGIIPNEEVAHRLIFRIPKKHLSKRQADLFVLQNTCKFGLSKDALVRLRAYSPNINKELVVCIYSCQQDQGEFF